MLTDLTVENFRGFDKHKIPLNEVTVIVGQNNAGKSTLVEAFRLIAIVTGRYRNLSYNQSPSWSDLPKAYYGVSPSLQNLEINFNSIFHRYGEPPSMITANFKNNSSVTIYLSGEDKIFAVIRDGAGKIIKSRQHAYEANLPTVSIMPQVTPVQRNESILNEDYVKRTISSSLSSLHFRNQLNVFFELFPEFQEIVENTWPGVRVLELIGQGELHSKPLDLQVRNEDFVAEIGAMGHGLQMWLQTMWFLTRSKDASTIILDEPDVYMHADLQRRIIRFLRNRFPQIILTTHSVEIMSEVQPDEILIIDKRKPQSKFASSLPAVQSLIDNVGSVHNIHLARLWHARRFILVEGKDLKLLKQLQNILFPTSKIPIDIIPNMTIGGWGGWNYAVGSSMTLKNSLGESIVTYCILDSDYHTQEEIKHRKKEAKTRGVELHIWSQKEIENYLLVPSAIQRLIAKKCARRTKPPSIEEVAGKIRESALNMEEAVFDALSAEFLARDRSLGAAGANKEARKIIKERKERGNDFLMLVSGKTLISELSRWSQDEFGVSLNPISIATELRDSELHREMVSVVTAIENCSGF
jgi:AAA15 family ATPase/GTPase